MTKMPPITISSSSVLVSTASAAIARPGRASRCPHEHRGREGVEPQKADAGPDQAGAQQRQILHPRVMKVIAVKARNTIAAQPAARPSSPSVSSHRSWRPPTRRSARGRQARARSSVDNAQAQRVLELDVLADEDPQRHSGQGLDEQLGFARTRRASGAGAASRRRRRSRAAITSVTPRTARLAALSLGQDQERACNRQQDREAADRRGTGLAEGGRRALPRGCAARTPECEGSR